MAQKRTKKSIKRKRRLAALKGWRTRRANQKKKKQKKVKHEKPKRDEKKEIQRFINALEESPGKPKLQATFERHYGESGFNFELENEILKVSISTKKTRGKKFSVRG